MSKREPHEVWKALVKEADDDEAEFQRAAGATPEEVDASLAAQGLDPESRARARRATGVARSSSAWRCARRGRRSAGRARGRRAGLGRGPPADRGDGGRRVGGGLVYALTHPAPSAPVPAPSTPLPEPPPVDSVVVDPLVAAATLRENAFAECDAKQWDKCLANLESGAGARFLWRRRASGQEGAGNGDPGNHSSE